MKKVSLLLLLIFLIMTGCQSADNEKTVTDNEEISKSEEMFNLMVDAKNDNRELTKEEAETLQDFYMFKPLEDRGDDLDHALSQMFFNFYNDAAFEQLKSDAEKLLKES